MDRVEEPLRTDPQRAGKVGTLKALEVIQTSRHVADAVAEEHPGPCQIDWRPADPFALSFRLDITVSQGRYNRSWREEGRFSRDPHQAWEISSVALFQEGHALPRRREYYVFADHTGFYERLGPDRVARFEPDAAAAQAWEAEFKGRFAELVDLLADGWTATDDDRLIPGTGDPLCYPQGRDQAPGWAPLLKARADLRFAEITSSTDDDAPCREVSATLALTDGGSLEVSLRECLHDAPERLFRADTSLELDVDRDRDRGLLFREWESWIDQGLIETR